MQKILVWDWPVRIGHWLMVGGFVLAWLTSDSETFRLLHVWAGGTVLAVAAVAAEVGMSPVAIASALGRAEPASRWRMDKFTIPIA